MAVETWQPPLTPETGIETHGIERVPPDARTHARVWDNFTLWLSANLVIPTVALGGLAVPVFGLGVADGVGAVLLFNILGVLPVAFFSTLGPKLGLRQMTISLISFGWAGAMVMALFNVAACLGWSVVNVIIGGQLVAALSHDRVPAWAGILMIAALTTLVSVYGYGWVHRYERWAWVPMALIFAALLAVSRHGFVAVPTPALTLAHWAGWASFGAAVYGFATGWSSYAADYTVNQPEDTPAGRVFWLTFAGVVLPCVLLETFGLLLTTVPAFHGLSGGRLLAAAAQPLGGLGTALLALLALSIVANNIPNDYSLGLSLQVLGPRFQRVHRAVWTLIGAAVYVAVALPRTANFAETLEGFLLVIAYWLGPWAAIVALEHFVFRRGRYDADDWNTPSRLPAGWAALVSMGVGLAGVALGAAQQVFTGPLAKRLGGMDIGFEMGTVSAALAYLVLRRIEVSRRPVL